MENFASYLTAKLIFLPCNFTNVCTILLPPLFAIEQRRKVKIPRRTSVLANCTYDVHLLIGRASCNTVEYFKFFTPKVKSFTYLIRTFVRFLGSPNYVSMKIYFKPCPSRAVHCVYSTLSRDKLEPMAPDRRVHVGNRFSDRIKLFRFQNLSCSHRSVIWQSSCTYHAVIGQTLGSHQAVVGKSPGSCWAVVWQ